MGGRENYNKLAKMLMMEDGELVLVDPRGTEEPLNIEADVRQADDFYD